MKYAIIHGPRHTATKYHVSESTVHGFVKSLKRHQAENPGENVVALPLKKRGRPKLLPEELDVKVIQMVKSMRNQVQL